MTTLKKKVEFFGGGIHLGVPVKLVVKPSKKFGIFFRRTDLPNSDLIPARFDNVGDTKMRNTTVGDLSGAHVKTVEHLMAALFVAGINSAIVEIAGPETPILDGSAKEFLNAFIKAGVTKGAHRKIIVRREVSVSAREALRQVSFFTRMKILFMNFISGRKMNGFVKLGPSDNNALNIDATLVYKEPVIGTQSFSYSFDGSKKSVNDFIKNVARARTFGKYSEWEYLKAHGMGRGANENNVIALNDSGDGTLNKLFWKNEFVRHKIIDAVGDMFTSHGFVVGNLTSYKGSHAMNNLVLRKLFANSDNYEIIDEK
jgi:UDP-3-O-[3-hydroxymyristoyl] N-acetylglucosamine deacetylase